MKSMKTMSPVAVLLGWAFALPAWAEPAAEPPSDDPSEAAAPADATVSEEQPDAVQPAEAASSVVAEPSVAAEPVASQSAPAQPAVAAPAPAFPPGRYPFAYPPPPIAAAVDDGPHTSWAPLRFAIALENRTSWLLDDGAKRVVGDQRASATGLSLQADVLRPREGIVVRTDLAWVSLSRSAYVSNLSEQLKSNLVSLGLSLRYELLRWLAPYARIAGGIGWDKLTVAEMHDRKLFGHGSMGAGLFLRSPGLHLWRGLAGPGLALMGQIEGGYAVASGSDFVLHADARSSSENPIPLATVPLGHVARNVPYLRVSLGLAF